MGGEENKKQLYFFLAIMHNLHFHNKKGHH